MRFLSPRVQLQLPQGVAPLRLEIAVPLIVVRQPAVGIQDLLVQTLALYQRPVLKLGTILQEEAVQELASIALDQLFQARRTDRRIFAAPATVLLARLKTRFELGEVKGKVTGAVELNGLARDEEMGRPGSLVADRLAQVEEGLP